MFNFNWGNFNSEEDKIELLDDEGEKELRYQLLDEIREKVSDYEIHLKKYEYNEKRNRLIENGIMFMPIKNHSSIKAKWSKIFSSSVTKEEKRKVFFNQYRWHLFSYEVLSAIKEEAARKAFDEVAKTKVYAFYQHKNDAFLIENAQLLKSSDFDLDYDIYIFDETGKWTYIHTHEDECGPYFYGDVM